MRYSKVLFCSVFFYFTFLITSASSAYFNTNLTTITTTTTTTTTIITHQCSPQQTLSLLLFKQNLSSINGTSSYCQYPYPVMMNWVRNTDFCDWDGVTCDHSTGDVIGLDLRCGMLQSTLHPNTSLFNLPRLQSLNLAFNDFTGSQLPSEIGRFSNTLTHLNISSCYFSGQVPVEITLLHKLVSLDLPWNNYFDKFILEPRVFTNMLQNYTSLEELSLGAVNISSVLPASLNISSSLKQLELRNTGLQGTFPWEISLLPKLVSLDLLYNYNLRMTPRVFDGLLQNSSLLRGLSLSCVNIGFVLPTYLNISSSLIYLDLESTSLKGKLPDNIFNLKVLSLSYCSLTGPLPKSIVNLRRLTTLRLSSNKLNGTLPSSLFSLQSLEELDLGDNQFDGRIEVLDEQGPIPQTFQRLTNLIHLDLSYNNFSGDWELETLLSSLTNLNYLTLSYSGLSVTTRNANTHVNPDFHTLKLASCKIKVFPESLRYMINIYWLDLSCNKIQGKVPYWAGEIGGSTLYYLNLSHNFITGLPQFQWYQLEMLYLQSNLIQGPFPSSICNMSYLSYLDLSNNSFDGVIPECFGNMSSYLKLINLGNNHFRGTIPNVYDNYGYLEGLILNGNQLNGEVPSSLSKCQSLKVLDMGNNHLNGTFPHLLGSLPNLQVLILKSNRFHGSIVPSSDARFPFQSLQVFDLSYYRFVGQLPEKYFYNFNAMKSGINSSTKLEYLNTGGLQYTISVSMKGREQLITQIFVGYKIVSLSHNQFDGEIPDNIGSLNLLIVLDLSHNNLFGRIPHAVGKLSKIESLDLSWNQLTGRIPQSLVDLTSLGFLKLSQNKLQGLIPVGKQFNTFEANSFEGNPNLCGLPLHCNPPEPHVEDDGEGDEEESWFTWRAVMLGYGCGTIIGLVMGYLMLSTGRPIWFNAIVDAGEQMILKRRNKRRYIYIGR